MHVVVNAVSAHQGGIVTYTKNLVRYLPPGEARATVFVPQDFPGIPETEATVLRRTDAGGFGVVRRTLWEQFVWPTIVRRERANVLFSSANYGVLATRTPQVLLVQGEISFNPVYRRYIVPRLTLVERQAFALRRRLVALSAFASDVVVFPSRTSMESVLDDHPSLADRSVVNYLAANDQFSAARPSRAWCEDGKLKMLYVSIYYPHKDPLTLQRSIGHLRRMGIPAEARISMNSSDFQGWSTGPAELSAMIVAEQTGPVTMGRIHHTEVRNAMTSHDVLVSPSIAETFGFPLVEAMGLGLPLVIADTAIHREICGDAALYFTPGSSHDLAERVRELNADPGLRALCASRGKARVKEQFTWEQHMKILIDCFKKVGR